MKQLPSDKKKKRKKKKKKNETVVQNLAEYECCHIMFHFDYII